MTLAHAQLRDFLSSFRLDGDPVRVRNALLEFFPDLVSTYGDVAALLGADFYDSLRDVPPSAASFRAALSAPVQPEQAQGSARWAVGSLFDGEPDGFMTRITGSTQRLVLQPGRDGIFDAARRDPVRTGIARVPSGPKTCEFCVMLASRGAVYGSELAAGGGGNEFHDDCDCVPTVIRSEGDYPEGHDLDELIRLYAASSGIGRDIPLADR